jgi:tetratricopeptide (TPR) repeat protein
VRDGKHRWRADNGQYLLGLDVVQENGILQMVEHRQPESKPVPQARTAEQWFDEALKLEDADVRAARKAYEQATRLDPRHLASWINWGRLLHEQGVTAEAERVYRRAIDQCGPDPLLLFNHGVLLEDLGDTAAALREYHAALEEDPDLADCHYNLARLYQLLGRAQHAIRHYGQYRRLVTGPSN